MKARTRFNRGWTAALLALVVVSILVPVAARADTWRVLHYDVDVAVDPAQARLEATGRLRLIEAEDDQQPLHFMLHRDLAVTSASLVSGDRRIELSVESKERWRPRDFWKRPDYAELGGFSIARQHTVSAPDGGWPDGALELEMQWAGAVYDSLRAPDVAYSRGFETTSGLIDPRGAFLTGQTFWIPWTSDERFTFRLRTDLPAPWHSMSQGERVEHRQTNGRNVTAWNAPHPHEEIYLVAGPYVIREQEHDGVALYTYTYENTPDDLCQRYLDKTAGYLDLYGERFGPYPFAKWAMVENWWQTGFGMPGFTLLGDKVIRLPFIVDTSYGHEILHCWWGNGVYVDYANGNWCEGLTAYGADYLYKTRQSDSAARDHRRNQLVGYLDFASSGERDFALRDFRERSDFGTQAIGYGKTMMVFHMLFDRLGEEVYLDALRGFYREHRFRPAGWADLAASFSETSGEDLGSWFEQWVQRVGAARLSLGEVVRSDDEWRVEIVQEGQPYALRIPVTVSRGDVIERRIVSTNVASTWLELEGAVSSVAVDPDFDLFRRLHREEIPPTLSQALGATKSAVVIGSHCEPAMAASLRAVAEDWARNQDMLVIDEGDFDRSEHAGRSLFLFGPGEIADRALGLTQSFDLTTRDAVQKAIDENASVVFTVRDPEDAEKAWVVVRAENPDLCEALGRKLPHYSKYSWLRFDGEQNTGKGAWTVVDSPLRRELDSEAGR